MLEHEMEEIIEAVIAKKIRAGKYKLESQNP
jgi:hypothetical protein